MQNIENIIHEQIVKYGTITIELLITLITPFLPPFIDHNSIKPIAILLLQLLTPTVIAGGAYLTITTLWDIAVFGVNSVSKVGKAAYLTGQVALKTVTTTVSFAADIVCMPLYLIAYPFRRKDKKQYDRLLEAINRKQAQISNTQMQNFRQMAEDSGKIFLVIRKIQQNSDKINVKMVGSLRNQDKLSALIIYLQQKETNIDTQSIQFICNRNLVNINSKISDLPKNSYGFVDLYYTSMETFG